MNIKKIVLVLLVMIFAAGGYSYSHPPSKMTFSYDTDTKVLIVIMNHEVKNPKEHYIEDVSVYLDDRLIAEQSFGSQIYVEKQVAVYLVVDANLGNTIKVRADCNKGGSYTGEYIVKKKEVPEKTK
ncbi:MAG: hypothetical protein ABIH89_08475 [Elusimicrobiota bacterium]